MNRTSCTSGHELSSASQTGISCFIHASYPLAQWPAVWLLADSSPCILYIARTPVLNRIGGQQTSVSWLEHWNHSSLKIKIWAHPSLCKQDTAYMHQSLLQYQGKCTQQKQSMSQLFYGLCAAVRLVVPGINQQVRDIWPSQGSIWSWVTLNLKIIVDQLMSDDRVIKLYVSYNMLMMKPNNCISLPLQSFKRFHL